MLYMGMSAFTLNSAAFVYHKAGVLSMYVTDDMVSLVLHSPSCQPASRSPSWVCPTRFPKGPPSDSVPQHLERSSQR